jgi:Major Facilitator Superfamily
MSEPPARHRGLLLAVLLAGMVMNNIDVAIVNVSGPSIGAGLSASGAELQLIVSGYVLAYAMLLITGARLGDLRGQRRTFLAGLAIFTLASLACGLAPAAVPLITARVVQGLGAALMVPQVLTGIQRAFPDGPARLRALGWYAAALSGGAVAGQVLGGVLVWADLFHATWRPVFLINVPIGIVLLVAAWRLLPPDGEHRRDRLDLAGVATLSATAMLAVLPLVLGRDLHWPLWAWICLAASGLGLAAFVATQRAAAALGRHPLINLSILTRPVWRALLSNAAASSTYFSMLFVLALYLQLGLGHSALFSGLALVSWVAAFGAAGPVLRRFPSGLVPYLVPAGHLLLASAYALLALAGRPSDVMLVATLGLGGLGLGCGFSATLAHLSAAVPPRFAADLSGLVTTTAQVSALAGVATFGTAYLAVVGGRAGASAATHAFAITNGALAATALVAAGLGYLAVRSTVAQPSPVDRELVTTAVRR